VSQCGHTLCTSGCPTSKFLNQGFATTRSNHQMVYYAFIHSHNYLKTNTKVFS
jgi:hypothetical protein